MAYRKVTNNQSDGIHSRKRRQRWIRGERPNLSDEAEEVFLTMQRRKNKRKSNGTEKHGHKYNHHVIALICLLTVVYGVFGTTPVEDESTLSITLDFYEMLTLGSWIATSIIVSALYSGTKFMTLCYWVFIYWPILHAVVYFFLGKEERYGITFNKIRWTFVFLESFTIFLFLIARVWYPRYIGSKQFLKIGRARNFWRIRAVSKWTMMYDGKYGRFSNRHTCKYEGEINENGLPHGFGYWLDDDPNGEELNGRWEYGKPITPFTSRQYGSGDTFQAVAIAYFLATDDDFERNNFFPTSDLPSRCGVASVECSVYGAFYRHLPAATNLYGPHVVSEGRCIANCIEILNREKGRKKKDHALIKVNLKEAALHVDGHVYKQTGLPFSEEVSQIVIDVCERNVISRDESARSMPIAPNSDLASEIFFIDDEGSVEVDGIVVDTIKDNQESIEKDAIFVNIREERDDKKGEKVKASSLHLKVQDWLPNPHKMALIFFPGWKLDVKSSLESFGQFVAMTELSTHVYPIVFSWPSGVFLTYRGASKASASKQVQNHFLQLLKGLKEAGIHGVHLMSHSMGVQSLLNAFADKSDGTRSEVSKMFLLSSSFQSTQTVNEKVDLMILKTIIMLNPDYPLEVFLDRAFLSIRRVCSCITILGDRRDQALYWSTFWNGLTNCLGYKQPNLLKEDNRRGKRPNGFRYVKTLGRSIYSIYFPEHRDYFDEEFGVDEIAASLSSLWRRDTRCVILTGDDEVKDRKWLDLDIIDTTILDTNIKNIRHSSFNVNPHVLKDLEDLIITGERAAKRSKLLHREGNIYSYCQAPSFVSF
mmetsp:Transcript_3835/g.4423  ORF Transcript_3835/g.4423 Transcript_3835/m.4423 type:complete len:820 (+) Transcript_3835:32-2491(+)